MSIIASDRATGITSRGIRVYLDSVRVAVFRLNDDLEIRKWHRESIEVCSLAKEMSHIGFILAQQPELTYLKGSYEGHVDCDFASTIEKV